MSKLDSVTVLKGDKGYTAHINFEDENNNEIISANNYYAIHDKVEWVVAKNG
jgi:hypothetical protein